MYSYFVHKTRKCVLFQFDSEWFLLCLIPVFMDRDWNYYQVGLSAKSFLIARIPSNQTAAAAHVQDFSDSEAK